MTTTIEKEGREICEAICKVADAGLVAIRDLGEAFARIAKLTVAMDEEVFAWRKRIK